MTEVRDSQKIWRKKVKISEFLRWQVLTQFLTHNIATSLIKYMYKTNNILQIISRKPFF